MSLPQILIDPIEAIWLTATLGGALITLFAVFDARADLAAHRKLSNGAGLGARGTVARDDMRRELLRLSIQVALLSLVVPAIFNSHPIVLSWPLIILIYVPVALFVQSLLDRLSRIRLSSISVKALLTERQLSDERIQKALDVLSDRQDVEVQRNDDFSDRLDAHEALEQHRVEQDGQASG